MYYLSTNRIWLKNFTCKTLFLTELYTEIANGLIEIDRKTESDLHIFELLFRKISEFSRMNT